MIPYASFAAAIYCRDGRIQRVQALELAETGFTFRLSKRDKLNREEIERIEVTFFRFGTYDYHTQAIEAWELNECDERADADVYSLEIRDEAYRRAAAAFTKEYLRYVRLKTEEDEETLTEELTGLPVQEPYGGSWQEQRRGWLAAVQPDRRYRELCAEIKGKQAEGESASDPVNDSVSEHTPVPAMDPMTELAIELSSRDLIGRYLSMPAEAFRTYYWRTFGLETHPLAEIPVTHLYIGDAGCVHRFPEREILHKLLVKTEAERLKPVIVLAPMAERMVDRYRELLLYLKAQVESQAEMPETKTLSLELVINDPGVLGLLQEIGADCFSVTAGTFFSKRVKDPRLAFKPGREQVRCGNRESSVDIPAYRSFLQIAGVEKVSYEVCGYPFFTESGSVLELPFYRTNTAAYCTLYAACREGERGRQSEVSSCPGYCEEYAFLYPENRRLVGLGNSLFGFDAKALTNGDYLAQFLQQKVERIVVNFR